MAYMVSAVFPAAVFIDLMAPGMFEIHVDIRHRHALRVQESLKEQVVLNGVNVRDAKAICQKRPCRRASSRPYVDVVRSCVADEIPYNQEIAGEPHLLDHIEFKAEPLMVFRAVHLVRSLEPVPEPLMAKELKVFRLIGKPSRYLKNRQVKVAKRYLKVNLIGKVQRRVECFRVVAEQLLHLLGAVDVIAGAGKCPMRLVHGLLRLHAQEDLMGSRIFLAEIVGIRCRYVPQPVLLCKRHEHRTHLVLLGKVVPLNLDIEVLFPEYADIALNSRLCLGLVASKQVLRYDAADAGRGADDAFMVLFQKLPCNVGLVVEVFACL